MDTPDVVDFKLSKKQINTVNKKLTQSLTHYRRAITLMVGDVPIETLCLPKTIETILVNEGYSRVYDLASRLNEFLAMC